MPKYISLGDNAISIGHESDLDIVDRAIEINKGELIEEGSKKRDRVRAMFFS